MRLVLIVVFFIFALVLSAPAQNPQTAEPARAPQAAEGLVLGKPLERPIEGGAAHDFAVRVAAGEAVRISVEQREVDVAVAVYDSVRADEKLNETDFSYGVFGTEELIFVAPQTGVYRVRVASADKTAPPGSYLIKLTAQGAASENDRREYLAEQTFQAGERARLAPSAESFREALKKYDEAARLWSESGNERGVAFTHYYKVIVYFALGDLKSALPVAQAALPLWHRLGNRHMEGATLNQAGVLANALGERQQALDFYAQALPLWRELKNAEGEGTILSNIGGVYAYLGDYRNALQYFEQALPLRRAGTDKTGVASTLNNIGISYKSLGEPVKAEQFFRESLAVARASNELNVAAVALGNLSQLSYEAGDADAAFDYLRESIETSRKTGNRFEESVRLAQLIDLYRFVNDYDRAVAVQQQTLQLATETNNRDAQLYALNALGRIYFEKGEYEKSRATNLQALELAKTLGNQISIARLHDNIGMNLLNLNRADEALEYLAQARDLWVKNGYQSGAAENFYNLGLAYRRKGDVRAALENFRQAAASAEQINAVVILAWANYEMAGVGAAPGGDLSAALAAIEKAVRVAEAMRANISRDDFRVSYFARTERFYELYVEILLRLAGETKNPEFVARALEASEMKRARAFIELLSQSGTNFKTGADAKLLEREREVNRRLSAKAERQTRLLSAGGGKTSADELKILAREIAELTDEREKIAAEIRRANPNYAALTNPAPIRAGEIQALLDRDTVLLEYSLGERQSSLWLVTNDSLEVFKLPKREEIESAARRFYESLRKNAGAAAENSDAAAVLSETLLKPVAEKLAGKRVVVVADGALQYIPFAALPNANEKKRFLIETSEVANLPSASALAVLRRESAKRKPASKALAVFADPVFSPTDPRVKNAPATKNQTSVETRLQRSLEETLEASESGEEIWQTIPRLPFSRREAEAILQNAPANQTLRALDFAASARAASGENLADYRIVHFATHGLLNSRNPELSGLVLSLVDEKGEPQNGFLRLNDVYNLRLNADLVVLSACQTALGRDIRGEGLIGLTRGFMYAGASGVVSSLWKVDDAATAELMRRFYASMLQKKMRPAEALRAAQIEMSRDERYRSPYFWAAFTLQGEWR